MTSPWVHVAYVESDQQPGKQYEVKRHRTSQQLGCSCLAYRFAKGEKTCKHLKAFGSVAVRPVVQTPYERTSVGAERFMVRRAITFEEMPT